MNDLLTHRHIGINQSDEATMLKKIGLNSLDELIDKTLPKNIRLKTPLQLPEAMTEYEFATHIAQLAEKNKQYATYIGQGWYGSITPAVIQRKLPEIFGNLYHCISPHFCRKTSSVPPYMRTPLTSVMAGAGSFTT